MEEKDRNMIVIFREMKPGAQLTFLPLCKEQQWMPERWFCLPDRTHKNRKPKGWGDGSVLKSAYDSCRRPELGAQHSGKEFTNTSSSSSKGFKNLLCPLHG